MKQIRDFISNHGSGFLLMDGLIPTLTLGMIKEELILYNIPKIDYKKVINLFHEAANYRITENTLISELSHGQKLLFSAIIALLSPAQNIMFRNYFTSLSELKRNYIHDLIKTQSSTGKNIKIIEEAWS